MFCTNCGKPTENNQPLCNDCLQAGAQVPPQQTYQQPQQAPYQQPFQPQQPYYAAPVAPVAPANNGLGKAIASNVLGTVAITFLYYIGFGLGFLLATLWAMLFAAPSIISIVTGAKAIKLSKQTNPPFTASKILGITGLVQGIIATILVALLPVVGLYNWIFWW